MVKCLNEFEILFAGVPCVLIWWLLCVCGCMRVCGLWTIPQSAPAHKPISLKNWVHFVWWWCSYLDNGFWSWRPNVAGWSLCGPGRALSSIRGEAGSVVVLGCSSAWALTNTQEKFAEVKCPLKASFLAGRAPHQGLKPILFKFRF